MKKNVLYLVMLFFCFPLQAKTRIVCIGDSVTLGYGTEESYPKTLQSMLGNDYEVVNMGVLGAKSGDVFSVLDESLLLSVSDFFLIQVGHNDMDEKVSGFEKFSKNLEAISYYCKKRGLGFMFLGLVQKVEDGNALYGERFEEILAKYNSEIEKIAESYDAVYIPVTMNQSLFMDRVHLSGIGNVELGNQVYRFLIENGRCSK